METDEVVSLRLGNWKETNEIDLQRCEGLRFEPYWRTRNNSWGIHTSRFLSFLDL